MKRALTIIRGAIILLIAGAPVFIAWMMIAHGARIPVMPEPPQTHNTNHIPGWIIIASESLIILAVVAALVSEWRNIRRQKNQN